METEKKILPKADKYIWAIFIMLLLVSVVELYSASSREIVGGDVMAPILRHGRILLLGVALTVIISRIEYRWLIPLTPLFAMAAIMVGIYVFFKGDIINGARRSTTLLGIPMQPAELLKMACVLVIALVMSRTQLKNGGVSTRGVAISAVMVMVCGGLLFSQGLTNTLLLMGVSFAMMLIAGIRWRDLMIVILIYGVFAGGAKMIQGGGQSSAEQLMIMETGHDSQGNVTTVDRSNLQKSRFSTWKEGVFRCKAEDTITSANRQEMYSFMAQANGGLINIPGNSRETSRLPLAFSDYIYAIVVEDWGFCGGLTLLALYLWLLARAGAIASRCEKAFPALLVMGMAVMIVLQALFHMAIVTGVFPVSGQPLPLISKGGSSILVTCIAFGVMLSVSRYAAQSGQEKTLKETLPTLPEGVSAKNPGKI